ncbi:MAG: 23S rRNA (adenine(2030)-N(6))-methyltransferase RlmJ [Pusillimonas sp.]|nr:23S rRNA (adenine(2030)-N(6))-methyltransferase RlmJ [Pusillimonas sp.]
MFSYRHAFHAANHADVIKHATVVQILDYFNQKEAPYWVIDTHAGAGIYDLTDEWASKNSEHESGLDRLLRAEPPPMIARYLETIEQFNPDGEARFYPGSPWLALSLLRPKDRLRLFELHPTEFRNLGLNIASLASEDQKKIQTYERDGFAGLKALLPPPTRRAVTLIDPSYEDKSDYRKTLLCLQEALKRFPTGCYLIWYPLVQRREATEMVRALERLHDVNWLNASLTVHRPSRDGLGLHGSGIFIVNPPWTLQKSLKNTLPWLAETLAQDKFATFTLRSNEAQKQASKGAQKRSPSGK